MISPDLLWKIGGTPKTDLRSVQGKEENVLLSVKLNTTLSFSPHNLPILYTFQK